MATLSGTAAVLLSLCACAAPAASIEGAASWSPPGSVLTAVGPDDWAADVATAAQLWADALAPLGCPAPFVVGDDGHLVVLVDELEHGAAVMHAGAGGWIEVEDGPSRVPFLLHELGHAMGLGHAEHGPSIMTRTPSVVGLDELLAPGDITAAAIALGCGEEA